jgi:hypothetical protein
VVLTPSILVLFELLLAPLTLNSSARDGFDGIEWGSTGGEIPGRTLKSRW